jgi:hypothetical protein
VVDDSVLARSVPPLEAEEQRSLAFRVHQVLEVVQLLIVGLDLRQGLLVGFMPVLEAGVDLAEFDLAATVLFQQFRKRLYFLNNLFIIFLFRLFTFDF